MTAVLIMDPSLVRLDCLIMPAAPRWFTMKDAPLRLSGGEQDSDRLGVVVADGSDAQGFPPPRLCCQKCRRSSGAGGEC